MAAVFCCCSFLLFPAVYSIRLHRNFLSNSLFSNSWTRRIFYIFPHTWPKLDFLHFLFFYLTKNGRKWNAWNSLPIYIILKAATHISSSFNVILMWGFYYYFRYFHAYVTMDPIRYLLILFYCVKFSINLRLILTVLLVTMTTEHFIFDSLIFFWLSKLFKMYKWTFVWL